MYKRSETDTCIIEMLPGNIFNVTAKPKIEVDLEAAKRLIRVTNEMLDDNVNFRGGIYDVSSMTYINDEARTYLSSGSDIKGTVAAVGIISSSILGRMMGNLFITLGDPRVFPVQFFDSPIRAEHWVRQKMKEAIANASLTENQTEAA